MNWYITVLKNYSVFRGRARRKEYWIFVLCNLIFSGALSSIDNIIGSHGLAANIYGLSVLIPGIAVGVRRMHDTNHSGWWLLIPLYNIILLAREGQREDNYFGSNPKVETTVVT